jgi:hypothetical protein
LCRASRLHGEPAVAEEQRFPFKQFRVLLVDQNRDAPRFAEPFAAVGDGEAEIETAFGVGPFRGAEADGQARGALFGPAAAFDFFRGGFVELQELPADRIATTCRTIARGLMLGESINTRT